jgi:hypothetical protein
MTVADSPQVQHQNKKVGAMRTKLSFGALAFPERISRRDSLDAATADA